MAEHIVVRKKTGPKPRQGIDLVKHFWSRVSKSDGCWTWNGWKLPRGYGLFHVEGKSMLAHRFSWTVANGTIPSGLHVCHHCDNPPCVRPDHLFVGTRLDNSRDSVLKGRTARGNRHGTHTKPESYANRDTANFARGERVNTAKLTREKVETIREVFAEGGCTQQSLAVRYGVSKSAIWYIVRGKSWR